MSVRLTLLLLLATTVVTSERARAQAAGEPAARPVASQAFVAVPRPALSAERFKKWEKEIAAFEEADRRDPPKKGGVLFIGSSTIKRWTTLAQDFPDHHVINRGFGGSQIADSTHFADRIIFPYAPSKVFLRAGGNDLHAGLTPVQVAQDFAEFVQVVHDRLPNTEVLYVPVNPAPARWGEADKNRELNRLIRSMALSMPFVGYVDAEGFTVSTTGKPRVELFVEDQLHLNADGYKLLADEVRPYLPVVRKGETTPTSR
jgi:lysophospholipase L1-like esterase